MEIAPVISYCFGSTLVGLFSEKDTSVCSIIIPADVRADTCTADSGAAYNGCGVGFSLSEQRQVSLRLICGEGEENEI